MSEKAAVPVVKEAVAASVSSAIIFLAVGSCWKDGDFGRNENEDFLPRRCDD